MRDGPCSLVTHVLPPSSYQSRRSISVTWPIHGHVSQFSNRATRRLHGARCDEPPRRWLPRGTGCVRVARARGRDAAAPPLVKVRLLFGAEVQCTGSAIWRTAFLSSHPPFSFSSFPFLSFLFFFLWAPFFYRRESWSIFTVNIYGVSSLPFFSLHGWSL